MTGPGIYDEEEWTDEPMSEIMEIVWELVEKEAKRRYPKRIDYWDNRKYDFKKRMFERIAMRLYEQALAEEAPSDGASDKS